MHQPAASLFPVTRREPNSPITKAHSTLSFVTLDVFTTTRHTGNPLAIVNVPASLNTLSQSEKQRTAHEFNLSETVFLHEQTDSDTVSSSVRIDIFTAYAEVFFAGHPTVGTANYLLRILDLQNDSNGTRIAVAHDVHIHADHPFADQPFFDRYQYPVVSIVKGMTFILAQLPDLDALARQTKNLLGPENTYTSQDALDQGWRTGIMATYTRELRARVFGSREDPATGSAASALAVCLALQTGRAGRYRYRLTQGVEMGQNSQIAVEVSTKLATATTEDALMTWWKSTRSCLAGAPC
ncbi:hypothetical protein LTR47_011314 [Exophiala xenobiotica]|nr:hypothetical protein LTR47_011314 [Exophiala xenobiotica]KAK5344837.1 hypothetical protein LTR61_011405 [Exophiala xenobiotica]KAK5357494.1 hypothetical protein LTR11_011370 [Exophiala xenobiotica]KAK5358241.1 hypothetical protein LTS03_011336 [Exophiala xenobiotica]